MSVSEQVEIRAEAATSSAKDIMLLDFVREYEASCPVCGYNLKALTRPVCPECGHELTLTVGAPHLHLGWLLASLAPGFFSGIAAVFVVMPVVGQYLGNGRITLHVIAFFTLDLFGWCSGAFAIILARKRRRFLAQSRTRQRWWAIITWLIHIAALGLFILFGAMYL
jgi:hypothetical protein